MDVRSQNRSALIVKASKAYLYWGLSLLVFGATWSVVAVFLMPGDDPLWVRLAFGIVAALLAATFLLPYKWVWVEIDGYGITSHRLFKPTKLYLWSEIDGVEMEGRLGSPVGYYFPCVIRSNGKKIAVVPHRFDGYEEMVSLLSWYELLKEGNNYMLARLWVKLSEMKPKNLFGRKK